MELRQLATKPPNKASPNSDPGALIEWMLTRFHDRPMIATSAFGMEGCALIGMIAAQAPSFTVAYLDTGFFFPETHELLARLRERYPHLEFVNRGTALTPEQQADQYGDQLWKRDPDLCCRLRKIDPLAEVMKDVDVWVTALRRAQSAQRADIRNVEWDFQYDVLKISPLAGWERADVWAYVQEHDVPYNVLHQRGYPSIGCTHCTQPVPGSSPADYSRDGRWSGQNKSECGLHGYGI